MDYDNIASTQCPYDIEAYVEGAFFKAKQGIFRCYY